MDKVYQKINHLLFHTSISPVWLWISRPTFALEWRCDAIPAASTAISGRCRTGEGELSTVQWFDILEQLSRWLGRFHLVFTGGEALLRTDIASDSGPFDSSWDTRWASEQRTHNRWTASRDNYLLRCRTDNSFLWRHSPGDPWLLQRRRRVLW